MPAKVLVGLQWGDEGKAKVLDELAETAELIVRYQGGSNAGHTVWVGDQRYAFHLVPSGVLREGKLCLIGNGVVLEPAGFVEEVEELRGRGVRIDGDNLKLSALTHLVMPYHRLVDGLNESRLGDGRIGTTGRGIGPTYADKYSRTGIRAGDLLNPQRFRDRVAARLATLNPVLESVHGEKPLDVDEICEQVMVHAPKITPFIADTSSILLDALDQGREVLFEGAQGALLDIDFGTYPYVTSSNSTTLGAAAGSGVPPFRLDSAVGIVKAYTTRVGAGPFPTELEDHNGELLRKAGNEFGTTTGRPRRCGWFDSVAVSYTARLGGVREATLTKLDVLDGLPVLKIATGYRLNGASVPGFGAASHALEEVEPVYEEMPGWQKPTGDCRKWADLPVAAQNYIERLEELTGLFFSSISVGFERGQNVRREKSSG